MPSGGLKRIEDRETCNYIAGVFKQAQNVGLETEWFMYFIGGVKDGVDPREAAERAAEEWDF